MDALEFLAALPGPHPDHLISEQKTEELFGSLVQVWFSAAATFMARSPSEPTCGEVFKKVTMDLSRCPESPRRAWNSITQGLFAQIIPSCKSTGIQVEFEKRSGPQSNGNTGRSKVYISGGRRKE